MSWDPPKLSILRDFDARPKRPVVDISPDASPLEVMLAAMRNAVLNGNLDLAHDFARDAAPYVHPRLGAVAVQTRDVTAQSQQTVDRPPALTRDEWLARRERELAAPAVRRIAG